MRPPVRLLMALVLVASVVSASGREPLVHSPSAVGQPFDNSLLAPVDADGRSPAELVGDAIDNVRVADSGRYRTSTQIDGARGLTIEGGYALSKDEYEAVAELQSQPGSLAARAVRGSLFFRPQPAVNPRGCWDGAQRSEGAAETLGLTSAGPAALSAFLDAKAVDFDFGGQTDITIPGREALVLLGIPRDYWQRLILLDLIRVPASVQLSPRSVVLSVDGPDVAKALRAQYSSRIVSPLIERAFSWSVLKVGEPFRVGRPPRVRLVDGGHCALDLPRGPEA